MMVNILGIPLSLCLLSPLFFKASPHSVHIRSFDVPSVAKAGSDVELSCEYDLQGSKLYMVKWYKGYHEFYRYMTKHKRIFYVESMYVNLDRCGAYDVMLENVNVNMSGRYTCEVSTEVSEDFFVEDRASAEMKVVELPKDGPSIQAGTLSGSPITMAAFGDKIKVNCTMPALHPIAKLAFYINGEKIVRNSRLVKLNHHRIILDDAPLKSFQLLAMEVVVRRRYVSRGKMNIKCEATIDQLYQNREKIEVYVNNTRKVSSVNTNSNITSNDSNSNSKILQIFLAAAIITIMSQH